MATANLRVESRGVTGAMEASTAHVHTMRESRALQRVWRVGAAACILLGPFAVSIVRATVPSVAPRDGAEAIAAMAADPTGARVALWAGLAAALLLPFTVTGLTRLVAGRAPLLATAGGALALVGWSMVPALVALDAVTFEMAAATGSGAAPDMAALWNAVQSSAVVGALTLVFVVGHLVGTALLGVGLARARVVPVWAAAAVVLGDLLHLPAHVWGSRPLDLVAFAILVAGCARAALAALHTSDDGTWGAAPQSLATAAAGERSPGPRHSQ